MLKVFFVVDLRRAFRTSRIIAKELVDVSVDVSVDGDGDGDLNLAVNDSIRLAHGHVAVAVADQVNIHEFSSQAVDRRCTGDLSSSRLANA
jgi:hypothetical protein